MVVVGLDNCGGGGAVVEVCMLVVERGVVCMVGSCGRVGWRVGRGGGMEGESCEDKMF